MHFVQYLCKTLLFMFVFSCLSCIFLFTSNITEIRICQMNEMAVISVKVNVFHSFKQGSCVSHLDCRNHVVNY